MFTTLLRKTLPVVSIAAFASVGAYATPLTSSVELVNPGVPPVIAPVVTIDGVTVDNVYVGPYTLQINGQDYSALCIDFFDDTTLNETWTAYQTNVGSSNLSDTYHATYGQEYEEMAYLFNEISQPGADRVDLQEAAWEIMAYGITSSNYTTVDNVANNTYIDNVLSNYSSMNDSGYVIVSDTNTGTGRPQEFIIDVAPEPPSFYLLLGPAITMAAFALRRQKRVAPSLF